MLRWLLIGPLLVACSDKRASEVKVCPDARACFDLGRVLKVTGDVAGAYAVYRRGCDELAGAPENCFSVALLASGDDYVMLPATIPPDKAKAQHYYEKACERGMGDGCANAGVHLVQESAMSRGYELLDKSCSMKSGLGCYNLGVAVRDGSGVVADRIRAATLFEQACAYEYGGGCRNLGLALMKGDGVVQDPKRAVPLLEKACSLTPKLCFDVALAHELGDGVTKDLGRARQLYDKGCTAGDMFACTNLASYLADGLGGPRDASGAIRLAKAACDSGVKLACDNLPTMR